MKLKNKTKLLNELAKESKNPADFIRYVMSIQDQKMSTIVEEMRMTQDHFYVCLSNIRHGKSLTPKNIVDIANGLDIEPFILNRLFADHVLKEYLKRANNGINQNTEGEIPNKETT